MELDDEKSPIPMHWTRRSSNLVTNYLEKDLKDVNVTPYKINNTPTNQNNNSKIKINLY